MTTRAMRRFTDEPVSDDDIRACLRAAVQAPSGGNIQPYQFLVVTDPEIRTTLAAIYLRAWERYSPVVAAAVPPERQTETWAKGIKASDELARAMADVPVHVLVLMPKITMVVSDDQGDMDVGPPYASVYPAVQNFILAARARGLGTVLTTVYRIYEDEVREACGIPDRYEVVALLPVGHPKGKWGIAPRRPAESLTSWQRFWQREPSPPSSP